MFLNPSAFICVKRFTIMMLNFLQFHLQGPSMNGSDIMIMGAITGIRLDCAGSLSQNKLCKVFPK